MTSRTYIKTKPCALTGAPDSPFGSNSRIASYSPPCRLAPPDDSLKAMKNITYSHQSFSYIDIISKKHDFVNRFNKKSFSKPYPKIKPPKFEFRGNYSFQILIIFIYLAIITINNTCCWRGPVNCFFNIVFP